MKPLNGYPSKTKVEFKLLQFVHEEYMSYAHGEEEKHKPEVYDAL